MEIVVPSPYCQPPAICPCHATNDSNRHDTPYLFMISPNIIFPSLPWSAPGFVPSLHRPKPSGPVYFSSLTWFTRSPYVTFCLIWFDSFACGEKFRLSSSGTFVQLHLTSCLLGPNTLLSTLVSLPPLNMKYHVRKYIWRAAKITYFYRAYIITFLDIWQEETGLWTHSSNYTSFF